MAEPKNPITPDDFNPEGKEYPHEKSELTGEKENHLVEEPHAYESDVTDEQGRPPGMRRTGHFVTPDPDNMAGEGWTLPTRSGGGWDKSLETSLEEQIDEPETPQDVNNK